MNPVAEHFKLKDSVPPPGPSIARYHWRLTRGNTAGGGPAVFTLRLAHLWRAGRSLQRRDRCRVPVLPGPLRAVIAGNPSFPWNYAPATNGDLLYQGV